MDKVNDGKFKYAVVIPAMNEAASIGHVVASIGESLQYPVIVVNDASSDDTATIARQAGATVLNHAINLGAWRATQTGIRYALAAGFEGVITCDADGQHTVQAVTHLIEHSYPDIMCTIGSCTERGTTGRHIAWWVFRRLSGLDVSDLTSGLRLYRRPAMRVLASKQATMFEYQDIGVLMMLKKLDMPCQEISVSMKARENGISRIFHSWGAVLKYLLYTFILSVTKIGPREVEKYHQHLVAGDNYE